MIFYHTIVDSPMLAVRSLVFALLLPGTAVVLIPRWIVARSGHGANQSPSVQLVGLPAIFIGGSILVWCIWDFARKGRGTVAPVDPPTQLVVHGLYRYVRNPMYVGALLAILGQAAFFRSSNLLWYASAFFVWVHLFVVFYEEPALRRRFGSAYEDYCLTVPRWVPKSRE
jgi:protein-S-isoprenylcysteine O-methyltransferase Ste14